VEFFLWLRRTGRAMIDDRQIAEIVMSAEESR